MYCIKVMYPKKPGSSFSFNLKHYLEVHVGFSLELLAGLDNSVKVPGQGSLTRSQ
jgi:hypothetical protein